MRGATTSASWCAREISCSADEDGVIVIPAEHVERVLVEAERLTEKEKSIRAELKSGLSLAEALQKYGHV